MSTVALFTFAEPSPDAWPSDSIGNIGDLSPAAGLVTPVKVEGWTGTALDFTTATNHGLSASDTADGDSLITGDCTIQAICSVDMAQDAGVGMVLCCRGVNDGTASERYSYGVYLIDQGTSHISGYVEVRMFWQDNAGTIHVIKPGTFKAPANNTPFLLTVTRRKISRTSVRVRYYVGREMIGEVNATSSGAAEIGDIGGGTTGTFTLGYRRNAGTNEYYYSGTIENLKICDHEMTSEEVESVADRLQTHQPEGVQVIEALQPAGAPMLGTNFMKFKKVMGQALGLSKSLAADIKSNFLPDRAYGDQLAAWERETGIEVRQNRDTQTRRDLVVAYDRQPTENTIPNVKAIMADVLDCDADDLEIYEGGHDYADDFATLTGNWLEEGQSSSWWQASSGLVLHTGVGADIRETSDVRLATKFRMAIEPANGYFFRASIGGYTIPSGGMAGLWFGGGNLRKQVWVGLYNDGGGTAFGYRILNNETVGSFVELDGAPGAAIAVRIRSGILGTGFEAASTHTIEWSYDEFASDNYAETATLITHSETSWVGFSAVGDTSSTGEVIATFTNFLAHVGYRQEVYNWFLYRNPALGGSPDMTAANKLIRKIAPAHTFASVGDQLALLCDDPDCGTDICPILIDTTPPTVAP